MSRAAKSATRPGVPARQPGDGLQGLVGPAWMDRSQCGRRYSHGKHRGKLIYNPDLWTPYGDGGRLHTNTVADAEAIRICHQCPVIWQCLKHAIRHNEPGIWGGMTEQQRGVLKARWEGATR